MIITVKEIGVAGSIAIVKSEELPDLYAEHRPILDLVHYLNENETNQIEVELLESPNWTWKPVAPVEG